MAESRIERLYELMKKIEENKKSSKSSENAPLFDEILQSTKGDSMSKRLSSQFIARLFKEFPEKQLEAYEAMVDLIEDEDVMIRKQVINDLPKLCKDVPIYVAKVADLLVQMMQTEDSQEQSLVNQSLMQALTAHPAEALTGLFDQLTHDEVADQTRERALRFLMTKLPHLNLTQPQEELLVQLTDHLLEDVTEEEFTSVVQLLSSLRCMRSQGGRQRLVDTVCQQADLTAPFAPTDSAAVARALECARLAATFLGKNANAKALLGYYLDKVLPVIDQVPDESPYAEAAAAPAAVSPRLELLRCMAELSSHAGPSFVATDKQLNQLLSRLRDLMPLPPTPPSTPKEAAPPPEDAASPPKPEEGEIEAPTEEAASGVLNFSLVECLLYAFHQLARTSPDFLTACPDRLADFTKRLSYFSEANQIYLRSLRSLTRARGVTDASAPVASKKPADQGVESPSQQQEQLSQQPEANAAADTGPLRQAGLVAMENIARLLRDLLRSPPVYRAEVTSLSWQQDRPQQQDAFSSTGPAADQRKRHADNGEFEYAKRRIDSSSSSGGRDRYGARNRGVGGGGGGGGWRGQRW